MAFKGLIFVVFEIQSARTFLSGTLGVPLWFLSEVPFHKYLSGGPKTASNDHFHFLTMHPPPSTPNHNNLYLNPKPIQDP